MHLLTTGLYFADRVINQKFDFFCGSRGSLCEYPDSGDRKFTALLACTGCFDGGIQGEDICLESDTRR